MATLWKNSGEMPQTCSTISGVYRAKPPPEHLKDATRVLEGFVPYDFGRLRATFKRPRVELIMLPLLLPEIGPYIGRTAECFSHAF